MEITYALDKISSISDNSRKKLQKIAVQKNYSKGDHLLELWHIDRRLHYIVSGSARVYYLREGRDGQFIGGLESLFTGKPSP